MNGAKGIASATNTRQGRGEIKDGLIALILEVHASDAPEGRVWFQVELKSTVEMGGVEMGMEDVASVTI